MLSCSPSPGLLRISIGSWISQEVHHGVRVCSMRWKLGSPLLSIVVVSEPAPRFPVWFAFGTWGCAPPSSQWNRCLSYGPEHRNQLALSRWFVCQIMQLRLWTGLGHRAVRWVCLTEILECVAHGVYLGGMSRNEMQSWKEGCHAGDSLQSNTLRKYAL